MERKEQEPFDREAWRRLLGADAGAPAKEIDRRVLAGARRALAPRIARWWLPASLAASLLLAVLIVQWQLADVGRPAAVTEDDVPTAASVEPARDGATPAEMEMPAPRQDAPASAITSVPPHAAEPAAPAADDQSLLRNVTVTGTRSATNAVTATTPAQAEGKADDAGALGRLTAKEAYAELRTPEQWYADIEALRAAGRIKEADAELARLKSKYPGWLESHEKKDP